MKLFNPRWTCVCPRAHSIFLPEGDLPESPSPPSFERESRALMLCQCQSACSWGRSVPFYRFAEHDTHPTQFASRNAIVNFFLVFQILAVFYPGWAPFNSKSHTVNGHSSGIGSYGKNAFLNKGLWELELLQLPGLELHFSMVWRTVRTIALSACFAVRTISSTYL
jgi:hypothetical protein